MQAGKIYSVTNNRRVLTQLKKFANPEAGGGSLLLGTDSMYGANVTDGKFKVFTMSDLESSSSML